eukprot:9598881-Lingulodinium_polyedra.AAC.1
MSTRSLVPMFVARISQDPLVVQFHFAYVRVFLGSRWNASSVVQANRARRRSVGRDVLDEA